MPTVQRVTWLTQLVTSPGNLSISRPHIGGWSESIWAQTSDPLLTEITPLLEKRAALLPNLAAIVGYRIQLFNLQPNRLIPGGASTFAVNLPGVVTRASDVPQMALGLVARTNDSPSTRRFVLRGIPDDMIKFGEFEPTSAYLNALNSFINQITTSNWKFIARDLSLPTFRVVGIAASTITVSGPHAIPAQAFVRLLRVRDINGRSVRGVFRVTNVPDANSLTVAGLTGVTAGVSGAVREDRFSAATINNIGIGRATVRKVGRPFEQYRGRRSRSARA